MRHRWSPIILAFSALLAVPAFAQQDAMHWHKDLESAKVVAKQTNRLVLVHFWTPTCGPCMALNQTVFNQPNVATAIESQFVPVKLNADENSATATWYGINRVPTDVIITPDGQMITKLVSPPTPAAYVAEMSGAAGKYATRSGQTFANAAANAPQPTVNAAYANLQVPAQTQLVAPHQQASPLASTAPAMPVVQQSASPGAPVQARTALATPATGGQVPVTPAVQATAPPMTPPAVAPQVVNNPLASPGAQPSASGFGPAVATAAVVAAPALPAQTAPAQQVNNPYAGLTAAAPAAPQQPTNPATGPVQTTPIGYDRSPLQTAAAGGAGQQPGFASAAGSQTPPPMVNAVPDQRQLPPGAPPLGFDGYCPVSMRNTWRWVAGDPRYGVVHRGRTYWFATAEEQRQFWTDPDRYTPALSGMDPVLALDHKQQVPGKREHSLDYDGLFYMFASEATLQQFTANPQKYSTGVRQAMGIQRGRLVR